MCGISGFSGQFSKALLVSMVQTQSHRGPDDDGIFFDQSSGTGLGHNRLSIIDLSSTGHQPMTEENVGVTICYNGEIYNYQSLRKQLKQKGYEFRGYSDTEVLLNLYLDIGHEMLDHIEGIFAFAIWDARSHELFVARDHFGIKPLYYAETVDGFIFASELKSILQSRTVDRSLNADTLFNHITCLWSPGSETVLKSVRKLEPGYAMLVSGHKIQKHWCYYDIPYHKLDNHYTVTECVQSIQEKLENAVRSQLVADVPVGAFLSGGLDSSAIVAMAKHIQPDIDMNCYTIGFKGESLAKEGMTEDLPYAKKVASTLGVKLNVMEVGPEMIMDFNKMVYFLDEPIADPACINTLYIAKLARQQGIKVLLSGTGGDDVFSGYRRHSALEMEKYWSWLPQPIRSLLKHAGNSGNKNIPLFRRLGKAFQYANLSAENRLLSYFFWMNPDEGISLFSDAFRHQLGNYTPVDTLTKSLQRIPADVADLNKMLYLEAKHFLADHNLNYTDKMAMAEGVEVRVPLLDKALVEFCTQIPPHLKQRGMQGKWIFKKAMEPYLPTEVIYRPKTGFGAPLRYWLKNELSELVAELLSADSIRKRGIFNPAAVSQMLALDHAGKSDYSYSIFSLLCIEMWCRQFIDSPVPEIAI